MSIAMTERIPGVPISLGESINVPVNSLRGLSPTRRHGRSTSESGASQFFKSRLPPAVANVPADHIRGYVHSKRVNSYLVGSTLGEGSFAKVKEAFHILVGEKVAMKVIDKKKAQQDPYVAKNFRREARLLQMVRHPNILHLMEVIETDTSFYLITELCSGGELMKHIYSKGRLNEDESRKYMRQIISSVDHLHRAGIIHRDLKVENMLLDGNMDIRIIGKGKYTDQDNQTAWRSQTNFGLSNEEYIQGENGKIHCSTQCGSPAYAAPELLGHKQYGPEVDIWSIGVNMYAMLTGCLPYTVEPFNITALHAKMLENKMNPIPDSLSPNCKGLLRRLLQSNPDERIKMDEIMSHPWINQGHTLPFGPAPFPNSLKANDINMDIVEHMVNILKVCETKEDLIQELIANRATSAACVYFLLCARLTRYQRKFPARKTRVRHKSNRLSRDQGYYEDGDDDDTQSTKSVPASRRSTRHSRPSYVPLRDKQGKVGSKDRPISHPPFSETPETPPDADTDRPSFRHARRKTLPPALLENEMDKFHETRNKQTSIDQTRVKPWQASTLPRQRPTHSKYSHPSPTDTNYRSHNGIDDHDPPYEFDYQPKSPTEPLSPVHHPVPHNNPGSMTRNFSHGHALNQLRQDLKDKLHPPQAAWRSNPGSRTHSRNPSRHGSRIPSSTSTRGSSMQSGLEEIEDEEDPITFHKVKSKTLPRNFIPKFGADPSLSPDEKTHLPALHSTHHQAPPTRAGRRTTSEQPVRKNGFHLSAPNEKYELKTDHSIDGVLSEVLRVAGNLKMRENELVGNVVTCHWKGIKFKLTVNKDRLKGTCRLGFQWYSGGDLSVYKELCERFVRKLRL